MDIATQIKETLDEVHKHKVEFQTKQFSELTNQQKSLTKMMNNLYLDKLKGKITESAYDKFYQSFRDQLAEVTLKLESLQYAEDNYFITIKYILDLTNRACDIF